jgi:hypothetical protein
MALITCPRKGRGLSFPRILHLPRLMYNMKKKINLSIVTFARLELK